MTTRGVARRYARAILEIAQHENTIEGWSRDLTVIRSILAEPMLQGFISNPSVPLDEKLRLVDNTLTTVAPVARNFVNVLLENGRISTINEVVEAFNSEVDRLRGIVHARVTTAVNLDEREAAELLRGLEKLTGRRVIVSTAVDSTLLGGFVARIGDQLIDASVVGRLNALHASLMA